MLGKSDYPYELSLPEKEHFYSHLNMEITNNNCLNDYDKNKELPYIQYWNVNNTYGWEMLQKFPVNNFEWIEDTSQFN